MSVSGKLHSNSSLKVLFISKITGMFSKCNSQYRTNFGLSISLYFDSITADVGVSVTSYGSNLTGEIYYLECSAFVNGSDDQLSFIWLTPDNNEVTTDSVTFNTTLSNNSSTLTINQLSLSHAGTYTCVVMLGGIELRENFTVEVESKK